MQDAARCNGYDGPMAADPAEERHLAYADYLTRERSAADKHEFVAGEVFAMAGGRRAHNLVAVNVARALATRSPSGRAWSSTPTCA